MGTTHPATHHDDSFDTFISPLSQRNASKEMLTLWSPRHRFTLWRKVWLAAAEAQMDAGLPISREQVEAIRKHIEITDDDIRRAFEHEKRLRHDVMAHVHALADVAPIAKPILHLGMTSQDVVCNADLLQLREALTIVELKLARTIDALGTFAAKWKNLPALGHTHFQPAQPTTVGRRASQWGYDLYLCLVRIEHDLHSLKLRGLKGATGTQASFLHLTDNRPTQVDEIETAFVRRLGWVANQVHDMTSQTYPRVVDAWILSDLAATASVIHKVCNDIRLLSGRKELDEPWGEAQIGSSAMPYKQNPMRCERATGLCRFVMSLAQDGLDTASTQWLERTLDDSSNRRLVLPEAFLALDGALDLLHSVASGMVVHEMTVRSNLMAELPFMALENIMMAAVKKGRDRQEVHEALRKHALAAGRRVKELGQSNDLMDRLRSEPQLVGLDLDHFLDPAAYIGRAREQVDHFVNGIVASLQRAYATRWTVLSSSEPRV
ncbi:MAG: adenylosuccinate lyase [Phycisphaeraceae bacterium]|nr:adenylosuccinate lyase [Phycisphaeraceae bacterium]